MFEHMSWGKQSRLNRIFAADGRTLMLAIDHGYFMGPTHGMEKPAEAIRPLTPHIDALMLSPGILSTCVEPGLKAGVVLRASGGNSVLGADIDHEGMILTAAQAVRLNADAVAISIYVGTEHEHETLLNLAKTIEAAAAFDLPVLGVTAVGKKLGDKKEKRYLALASRIAAEFGADVVKTYYCEGFEEVVAKTPVPIVVAGGPKLNTYRDVLELCANALKAGAAGVDMGRNIWQSDHPAALIQGVRAVLHENAAVDDAEALVNSLIGEDTRRKVDYALTAEDVKVTSLH